MYKKLYHNNNSSVTDSTKYTNNMQNKQNTESYTKSFTIINQNNKQKNRIKQIIMTFYSRISIKPLKTPRFVHQIPPSKIPQSQIPQSQIPQSQMPQYKYLNLKYPYLKYLHLKI